MNDVCIPSTVCTCTRYVYIICSVVLYTYASKMVQEVVQLDCPRTWFFRYVRDKI